MALQLTLPKTDNFIGCDFIDAYWSIDNITFINFEGVSYTSFELNTYPTREAKYLTGVDVPNTEIPFGGSAKTVYSPILHKWEAKFKTSDIFKQGIPLTEEEQKQILYAFVKEYTRLPFEDVVES